MPSAEQIEQIRQQLMQQPEFLAALESVTGTGPPPGSGAAPAAAETLEPAHGPAVNAAAAAAAAALAINE